MRNRLIKQLAVLTLISLMSVFMSGVATAITPTVPTNLTAVSGNTSVVLSWLPSSNTPTDYIIEYSADGFVTTTSTFIDTVSTATTVTVTNLTNGVLYSFRVKGTNVDGTSAASNVATGRPFSNHTPNDLPLFDACPASLITAAGFSDTNSPDVACIKHYGITRGTTDTTFSPLDSVSRWQMALFLTRLADVSGATLPNGTDQGFADISGKSQEIITAINQLKQLGITIGKTATTFAPDQYVTREEMALFLTRLLKAVPVGPGGNEEFVASTTTLAVTQGPKEIKSLDTDHNFTDLNSASIMETQNAIINLWNLGVTEVSTATIYEPSVNISRLNMAQMMARALDHTNARPAGLVLQASSYINASLGTVYLSATHRTSDFKPIANTLIDIFKYLHTANVGWSNFSGTGSCAQTSATIGSLTMCYIDSAETKTDIKGNLAVRNSAVTSGTVTDYHAWTAAAGTAYDNDIHAGGESKITVNG